MVKAILENSKTQTRRVIKPQPVKSESSLLHGSDVWHPNKTSAHYFDPQNKKSIESAFNPKVYCPYKVGDRLWVQENYSLKRYAENHTSNLYHCFYEYGDSQLVCLNDCEQDKLLKRTTPIEKKQPGRFMYRSCSRIDLEVVNVRVERLQDISEEDAIAEGVEQVHPYAVPRGNAPIWKDYSEAEFQGQPLTFLAPTPK